MEHGREVFIEEKKKVSVKEKLIQGKNWLSDHKEQVFIVGLSTAALTTYMTYQVFEGQSHDGFGDTDS